MILLWCPPLPAPNVHQRAKEETEVKTHHQKMPCHYQSREIHGLNNCIDKNTSLDEVRAPDVFERAKEEFQALAQVLHHKKEAPTHDTKFEEPPPLFFSSSFFCFQNWLVWNWTFLLRGSDFLFCDVGMETKWLSQNINKKSPALRQVHNLWEKFYFFLVIWRLCTYKIMHYLK